MAVVEGKGFVGVSPVGCTDAPSQRIKGQVVAGSEIVADAELSVDSIKDDTKLPSALYSLAFILKLSAASVKAAEADKKMSALNA